MALLGRPPVAQTVCLFAVFAQRACFSSCRASWEFLGSQRNWDAVSRILRNAVARRAPQLPTADAGDWPWAPPALPELSDALRRPRTRDTWAVTVAYDGTAFHGYAWQPDVRTVEGCLQDGLSPLLEGRHTLILQCAGRTDAGVSALGQVVSFYSWPTLSECDIRAAVDACRPGSLSALGVRRVPRSFHATFAAAWRWYVYLLPLGSASELDVEALDARLRPLVGPGRDMAALGRRLPAGKSTVCHLLHCSAAPVVLEPSPGELVPAVRFDIVGDRFIRGQVRTLVATAVESVLTAPGAGPLDVLDRATSGDRTRTASLAPAAGLCLYGTGYGAAGAGPLRPVSR